MKTTAKTKEQLIKELEALRQRIGELETLQAKYKHVKQELKKRDQIIGRTVHVWESANYPIFLHDTKGNFLYANEAAAISHGYTKEELIKIKYGKKNGVRVASGMVWKSMTEEMLRDSWGEPDRIDSNKQSYGIFNQWYYGEITYFFRDGKLIDWEEGEGTEQ